MFNNIILIYKFIWSFYTKYFTLMDLKLINSFFEIVKSFLYFQILLVGTTMVQLCKIVLTKHSSYYLHLLFTLLATISVGSGSEQSTGIQ